MFLSQLPGFIWLRVPYVSLIHCVSASQATCFGEIFERRRDQKSLSPISNWDGSQRCFKSVLGKLAATFPIERSLSEDMKELSDEATQS